MKTNQDYKNAALAALKGHWAPAVLTTLVYLLIILACNSGEWLCPPTAEALALGLVGTGSLLLAIFIMGPLSFGYLNALRSLYETGDDHILSNMFSLTATNYLHTVWTYVLLIVKIFLWMLLLIIPGIVKGFAYSMTPFIIKDHPELTALEAIRMSERMMKGHKFDLFYLELSFIGWILLAALTACIGFLWLEPYMETSIVSFYNDVKSQYELLGEAGSAA